ncbi:MAG: hypothetical protein Q8L08_01830 [Candidatus Nanopelagicaceae bacterium]|nr:hypothetical protein [Candidatus Nanopelagicaceae bacterium]
MSLAPRLLSFSGYTFVFFGVLLGILGAVQVGSIVIALGTAGVAISTPRMSTVGRFLPLAIALALFVLALALPRGR